jgi:pimeloyl-ACP methyl ester carboxylesterase
LTVRRARRSLKAKNISLSEFWCCMIETPAPPAGTAENHSTDRYLDVIGARLRYRDEGRGPAVILLHGWTLDLDMWDPQVAGLRNDFRLMRFDRRGTGLSNGHPDAGQDAADIAALCCHAGVGRASLIGMSQGARAALQFAARTPDRVCALILDGPPDMQGDAAEGEVPIAHLRGLLKSQGIDAFRKEWSKHPLVQLRTGDQKMRQLVDKMIARYSGQDLEAAQTMPSLSSATAPTLILSGECDLSSRKQTAARLAAHLRAEHVVVPGAGHLINLDQPQLYNDLCRAFLARHFTRPTN